MEGKEDPRGDYRVQVGNGDGLNERNDRGEGEAGPQAGRISGVALVVFNDVFR